MLLSMKPPRLELTSVSKAVFRKVDNKRIKVQILSNITLTVQQGDLVTIMGASGSGKTTLLRLINRLSDADSGIILLNGKDIRDYPPTQLRRKVGMVFQVPVMFKGSVRDNLTFGMKLWGVDMDIEALVSDVYIHKKLLDVDTEQLSVGEKQRICIARALANKPEVLLLDEPTSSLDVRSAEKIESLMLELCRKQDLTILWVTHETEQAERIGGKRLMLTNGRLVEHD
jgi:ABC-type phosphate transport system ATPase subunit